MPDSKVKDDNAAAGIITRERATALALVAATTIALYICYLIMRPFLPVLVWALALAVVALPLHNFVLRHIRREGIAAGVSVFIISTVIIMPVLFVADRLTREAIAGAEIIRVEVETGHWREVIERSNLLRPALHWVESNIDVRAEINRLSSSFAAIASSVVTGSAQILIKLVLTLFVLFYFFRDKQEISRGVRSLLPLSRSEANRLFTRVKDTIYATVYGTIMVSMAQGLLGGLMFWWLGLPAPVIWGIIMGLLSMVPVLGAVVIWGPAAVFLLLQGSWVKALILVSWGMLAIGLIDNFLYPTLVGKQIKLHTLLVFFGVLGGLSLFGMAGLILGPLIIAVTGAILDIWRNRTRDGRTLDEGG